MSTQTSIEWTEVTWNPTTGCDQVSPGCDHCYALTMAKRLKAMGNPRYQRDGHPETSGPGFGIQHHWDLLQKPRQWKKPRLVFVNSMSDLFHARVPFEFVEAVWDTMYSTPQHTYQILTKRPDRMARFSRRLPRLANVWLGTSVEDQEHSGRVKDLLQAFAAVRFLSVEPMLGPIDLRAELQHGYCPEHDFAAGFCVGPCPSVRQINWVIVGGESGPGARPCELDWLRDLRGQCQAAGVAFFLKQLGGYPDKRGHDRALLDGRLWREMPHA